MENYLLYDDTYLGPGYFIISKENKEIRKFLKIFIMNEQNCPSYGLRAFGVDGKDNPNNDYTIIDFSFPKDTNLYNIFYKLFLSLNGKDINTIDKFNEGNNHFSLKEVNEAVILSIYKDIYGINEVSDFIDLNLGDDLTCPYYAEIATFFNDLAKANVKKANEEDIEELRLKHLK